MPTVRLVVLPLVTNDLCAVVADAFQYELPKGEGALAGLFATAELAHILSGFALVLDLTLQLVVLDVALVEDGHIFGASPMLPRGLVGPGHVHFRFVDGVGLGGLIDSFLNEERRKFRGAARA